MERNTHLIAHQHIHVLMYTCLYRSSSVRSVSGLAEKQREREGERKRRGEGENEIGNTENERLREMSANLLFVRAGNR